MRVAVIFHRIGPYHCARLEAAARHCDVTGIEIAAETQDYAWLPVEGAAGYSRVTLFPSGDTRTMSAKQVSERVEDGLQSCSPDTVAIPGWSDSAAIAGLRWCAETGTPAILMSESTADDDQRVRWREWVKQRIVDLYSTALVGGQRHIDYLVELRMPRDRIFTGYDVVDNDYFARSAFEIRNSKFEIRKDYGLPENYFLASARFIKKKNLPIRPPFARPRAPSRLQTVRQAAGLLRAGQGIRSCQRDRTMGIGRERSERIGFASDRVESLWMCAGIGAGQWVYF